ncbi:MAG: hypothetical protein GXX92_01025 [Clostridiales bacterium]|nr:hypothetical protein [Clostridiales bacterium]
MKKMFSKVGLLMLSAVMVGMLGVSYAGYTDILTVEGEVSTGSMGFEFMDTRKDRDFLIGLETDSGKFRKLDANIDFDGKSLSITDIGPIDFSLFESGNAKIFIRYSIAAADGRSVQRAATIKENDSRSSLGEIPLELISKTPEWSISGKSEDESYGCGSENEAIDAVPQVVYDLLPDTLGQFRATHTLLPNKKGDRMEGVITLDPADSQEILSARKVELSEFDLPDEVLKEMVGIDQLELSIQGCYGFEIPLVLDQFNAGGE